MSLTCALLALLRAEPERVCEQIQETVRFQAQFHAGALTLSHSRKSKVAFKACDRGPFGDQLAYS